MADLHSFEEQSTKAYKPHYEVGTCARVDTDAVKSAARRGAHGEGCGLEEQKVTADETVDGKKEKENARAQWNKRTRRRAPRQHKSDAE